MPATGPWEASLPKAREWLRWIAYHQESWQTEPWGQFLVDAQLGLHQTFVVMSRRLRNNPTWDEGSMGERDWEKLGDDARARLAWFQRERPRALLSDHNGKRLSSEAPQWGVDLCEAMEGALRMQVRLADEIEAARRHGYVPVNVNPQAKLDEFTGAEVQ